MAELPSIRQTIHELGAELTGLLSSPYITTSWEEMQTLDTHDMVGEVYGLFGRCDRILQDETKASLPTRKLRPYRYDLTRRTYHATRCGNFALQIYEDCDIDDIACFAAEPRFARSLRQQAPHPLHLGRLPAAILMDEKDKPYAYQKSDGIHHALSWRDAWVQTVNGRQWIPQASIFQPIYRPIDSKNDPRSSTYCSKDPRQHMVRLPHLRTLSVVTLRAQDTTPHELLFHRFATTCLPQPIRSFVHVNASEIARRPLTPEERWQGAQLTLRGISHAAHRLLRHIRA